MKEMKENSSEKNELHTIKQDQKKQSIKVSKLQTDVQSFKDQVGVLTKVVCKKDEMIRHLSEKIMQIERRNTRKNVLIAGIDEVKGENCKAIASKLFKNKLTIEDEVRIKAAYRIGKGDNRPIVVRLNDVTDKGTIFKNVNKLRKSKSEQDKKVFINDHLPEQLAERQKRQKQIVKYNKTLIATQQQETGWKKGKLYINGHEYRPKIVAPTNSDILNMNPSQLQRLLAVKLFAGETVEKAENKFLSFALKVHSLEQVTDAYLQVKYHFANASHVVCAYRILDPDVAHMQDGIDDGEIGASRRILQMMIDQSFNNCVVFIVWHHSGTNIGPIRFTLMNDIAKTAIEAIPAGIQQLVTQKGVNINTGFTTVKQSQHSTRRATPIRVISNTHKEYRSPRGRLRGGSTTRAFSFSDPNSLSPTMGLLPNTVDTEV